MAALRACAQIRTAALTGTQCASYDQAKQWFMRRTGLGDTPATHLGASMLTGLATTTITAPIDLIKTNFFVGAPGPSNPSPNPPSPPQGAGAARAACGQPQRLLKRPPIASMLTGLATTTITAPIAALIKTDFFVGVLGPPLGAPAARAACLQPQHVARLPFHCHRLQREQQAGSWKEISFAVLVTLRQHRCGVQLVITIKQICQQTVVSYDDACKTWRASVHSW